MAKFNHKLSMYSVNAANKRFLLWQWSIKYHLNICIFTPIKLIHKFSKWYLKKTRQNRTLRYLKTEFQWKVKLLHTMSKMQCKNCLSLCAQRVGNVMRKLRNLEQNLMSDYFLWRHASLAQITLLICMFPIKWMCYQHVTRSETW